MSSTDFDDRVFELVRKIPFGRVTTYKELGNFLGIKCYQAVGQALKRNKKPIEIPCHRVVCSNGSLGGYFGKKRISVKIGLLKREGIKIKNGKIDLNRYLFSFKS